MTLNPSEIILTVVNFLLLLFFLNKFLFKPYFELMDSREEKNRQALHEQEEAHARIEENDHRLRSLEEDLMQQAAQQTTKLHMTLGESGRAKLHEIDKQLVVRRDQSLQQRQAEEAETSHRLEEKLPQLSEELLSGLLTRQEKEA